MDKSAFRRMMLNYAIEKAPGQLDDIMTILDIADNGNNHLASGGAMMAMHGFMAAIHSMSSRRAITEDEYHAYKAICEDISKKPMNAISICAMYSVFVERVGLSMIFEEFLYDMDIRIAMENNNEQHHQSPGSLPG